MKKIMWLVLLVGLVISIMACSKRIKPAGHEPATADYFSPATWRQIRQQKDTVNYPLIFIHGITGGFEDWQQTIEVISPKVSYRMRYLDEQNYFSDYDGQKLATGGVWNISYYTPYAIRESLQGDLTLYAQRLEKMIARILEITGQEQVVIIAHSMGGLIARRYMCLDQHNWQKVHKILTVGAPQQGVITSVGIGGQLRDLRSGSVFLQELQDCWAARGASWPRWGVIGAINSKIWGEFPALAYADDSAGPGFIQIASAIPYGEWQAAISSPNQKVPVYDTPHFGFRLAVDSNHTGLFFHRGTFQGIHWALRR